MAVNPNDPLSRDTVESTRQQLGYSQQFTQELRDQESIAQNLNSIYKNNVNAFKLFKETINGAKNEALALGEAIKNQLEALKKTNEYSSRYAELNEKIKKAERDFSNNQQKSLDIANGLQGKAVQLAQDYVDGLTARYKIDEKIADLAAKQLDLKEAERTGNAQLIEAAREEYIEAGLIVSQLKEKMEVVSQINTGHGDYLHNLTEEEKAQLKTFAVAQKQMDVSRNIVNNHQDELDILKEQLTPWQKMVSYVTYYNEKIKDTIKDSKVLTNISEGFNNLVDKIGLSFTKILENVLNLDKVLTDFGKNIQVSKEGTRTIADGFQKSSYEASSLNKNVSSTMASIKNQIEAVDGLNKAFGTSNLYTKTTRMDQIELVKGMGLQSEAASKIYGIGKLNNMTAHETAVAVGDQVINARKTLGVNLDYRKVLTEVANISSQLSSQYKNNPEEIAKAVAQAQKLGLTLEQAAKMSDTLVDNFAGSLSNELEAELLTGKQINLEQARYLALMGDSAGAAREMMNNIGGITEYNKLNILQQKSLAQSIGLSREELAKSLQTQEILKGTTLESEEAFKEIAQQAARTGDYSKLNAEIARASNGEQLAAQASQISNQEKFQMAIEKLQETLANLINGPFGTLIDKFTSLISKAGTLKLIMASIAAIISVQMLNGLFALGAPFSKLIAKTVIWAAEATFANAALTLGAGIAIAAAAALAGYSIINSLSGGEASVNAASAGGGKTEGGINVPSSNTNKEPIQINVNVKNTLNNRDLGYQSTEINKGNNRRND